MVSHEILVSELPVVNNMSTEDRLNYAQRRRTEQLERWNDFEEVKNGRNGQNENKTKRDDAKFVKFGDCITLLEAAARNDYDEVEELLKQKVNPNEANEDGLTALHQACIDNFDEIVELLLDYKADVNAIDSEHWTPLHAACTCGHTEIAEILVQRGANLLALNADHNMPYDICEEDDALEFIEQAMARKGITQDQINEARAKQEQKIIKDMEAILDTGGSINFKDDVGATVLHVAAANGYADLTRFFLLHTANTNMQDKDGWTALHAAACWCQMEIVEILAVENHADTSIKNNLGELPADVTEDEEIKALLQKLLKSQNIKKNKLFRGLRTNGRNSSSRQSGLRGQSFKGRSKRDKKNGISAVEAKSEAQYWIKGQETDMFIKLPQDGTDDEIRVSDSSLDDEPKSVISDLNENKTKSTSFYSDRNVQDKQDNSKKVSSKKTGKFKFDVLKKKNSSPDKSLSNGNASEKGETLNELKQRRSQDDERRASLNENAAKQSPKVTLKDMNEEQRRNLYAEVTGSKLKRKRTCLIL